MTPSRDRRYWLMVAVAGMLLLLASCEKGKARATEPDGAEPPNVEAAVALPRVEKGSEGLLIVYRETGIGYVEAYGADTFVYRFTFLPGGWIDGATLNSRGIGGEKFLARYSFSYAGDGVQVFESAGRESRELRVSGLTAESLRSGARIEGSYAFPEKGKVVYTERDTDDPTGAEATTISLWVDGKNDYRFRTEGIEPVNEVYVSGLMDALAGDKGLMNLVLIDLVLGESRNIKPVLAYALSMSEKIKR